MPRHTSPSAPSSPALKALGIALAVLVVLAYLLPLFGSPERVKWMYMTEDGYLMQTVARNMALGLGMTSADGTIATNGVQPLATLLHVGLYAVVEGDKVNGLRLSTLYSALVALAAGWFMFRVTVRLLGDHAQARMAGMVAALAWLIGPAVFRHAVNGLETGTYLLCMLLALDAYTRWTSDGELPLDWRRRVALGVLFGLVFWARNDGVFFIAAVLIAHVLLGGERSGGGWGHRIADAAASAFVSLLVAMPWLINNYTKFGSIVPISGKAESHKAGFGENLIQAPAIALEGISLVIPIPGSMERKAAVAAVCAVLIVALFAWTWRVLGRTSLQHRRYFLSGVISAGLLIAYYGLFFGAPWFMTRYFSAMTVFWWPMVFGSLAFTLAKVRPDPVAQVLPLGIVMVVLTGIGLAVAVPPKNLAGNVRSQHQQVVEWVDRHVSPQDWVAAVQTGTLGFWHDRTINLDGKVNPQALKVKLSGGDVRSYVTGTPVVCLADWVGIAQWVSKDNPPPDFVAAFDVRVESKENNLGVLCRRDYVPLASTQQ